MRHLVKIGSFVFRVSTRFVSGLASLEFACVELADAGRYECIASNDLGESATCAILTVLSGNTTTFLFRKKPIC